MRFGNWRGLALALALAAAAAGTARADLFHTIPREVPAVDINTGGPYMAPPIPYGHYAKEGCVSKAIGCVASPFCKLKGLLGLPCSLCGGAGCGACGGNGCGGNGCGDPNGGHGCGDPDGGHGCGACGGSGCGFCEGRSLLRRGCGDPCGGKGCGLGLGHLGGCGKASTFGPVTHTSEQSVLPSAQSICGKPGCLLKLRHSHRLGKGCNRCNGNGCPTCQDPGILSGSLCDGCHGAGCGACGGCGLLGGRGCGLLGGKGCGACGGRGCGLCCGAGGLHGLLGLPHAALAKLLHKGEVKYFVGPGGPVPITPGYVPYVVTTRSPRDFLAFPPFVDVDP